MSDEVDRALKAALEASRQRFSTQEEFFKEYCRVLKETIKPVLTDCTTNPTVRLQFLITKVSGDARAYALNLDNGKEGEHSLEFSPDFKTSCVTISTISPYGRTSRSVPLQLIDVDYVAKQAAAFLAPFLDPTL